MEMRTARHIEKGEQLFGKSDTYALFLICSMLNPLDFVVEYDSYMRDQPLEVRRKRLRKWFDADCQCERCLKEEAELEAAKKLNAKGDIEGKRDSKLAVDGWRDSKNERKDSGWDTASKPVFPEDVWGIPALKRLDSDL